MGEIKKCAIGKMIHQLNGFAFKSELFNQDGHGTRLCRGINITRGKLRFDDSNEMFWSDDSIDLSKYLLEGGDIVISMDGSLVGRNFALVNENDLPLLLVQRVARLRAKPELCQEYLYQWIGSNHFVKYVDSVKTSSGIPHISASQINDFQIYLPSLPEQQKIAAILSKWDELIETQTKLIKAKEKQKTSLMQKLLTGEVRFPGFEDEDIIEGVLSDFVGLKHGYQFRKEDFVQNGIPVIKIGNVIGQNLSFEGMTYISETRLEKFRDFQIYNGDLLMSLTGNIGRVVEVQNLDLPVVQNYRVGKFYSLSEEVLSRDFLKYLLSSPTLLNQLLSYANQSAQANFGKQDMDKLSVTFPANISEQKKVGGLLNKCDLELQSLKDELDSIKLQKKGLMQKLLTGKIRVKV